MLTSAGGVLEFGSTTPTCSNVRSIQHDPNTTPARSTRYPHNDGFCGELPPVHRGPGPHSPRNSRMVALDVLRAIESARHNGVRRERRPSGCLQLPRALPGRSGEQPAHLLEQGGDLVSPCRCVDSFVHNACLRRWRAASGGSHDDELHATFCAVCTAPFSCCRHALQPGCLLVRGRASPASLRAVVSSAAPTPTGSRASPNRSSDEAEAARPWWPSRGASPRRGRSSPSRRAPRRCKWPMRTAAPRRLAASGPATSRPKSSQQLFPSRRALGARPAAGARRPTAAARRRAAAERERRGALARSAARASRDLYLARKSPTQMARVVAQLAAHVTQQRPVAPPDLLLLSARCGGGGASCSTTSRAAGGGFGRAVVADIRNRTLHSKRCGRNCTPRAASRSPSESADLCSACVPRVS